MPPEGGQIFEWPAPGTIGVKFNGKRMIAREIKKAKEQKAGKVMAASKASILKSCANKANHTDSPLARLPGVGRR